MSAVYFVTFKGPLPSLYPVVIPADRLREKNKVKAKIAIIFFIKNYTRDKLIGKIFCFIK